MPSNLVLSYAQNREDIILSAFFLGQKSGFYVDVGASDPQNDSVTKYFYDLGWHGINIEPNPRLFDKLQAERPRDLSLNIGASSEASELEFREYEGYGLSTLSAVRKEHLAKSDQPGSKKFTDYSVRVLPLRQILQDAKVASIDFMKIDVEGYEYEVILGNDWERFRPKVLCIEANHIESDWPAYITKKGYKQVFHDGLNAYYVDTKLKPALEFKYISAAIGRDVLPRFAVKYLEELRETHDDLEHALKQVQKLELENQLMREKIAPLIYENEDLRRQLTERKRLRTQVKNLFKSIDYTIMLHIARLNAREPAKTLQAVVDATAGSDPITILMDIKKKDIDSFYDLKSGIAVRDKRLYVAVMASYKAVKKASLIVLKSLWGAARAIKKAGRKA